MKLLAENVVKFVNPMAMIDLWSYAICQSWGIKLSFSYRQNGEYVASVMILQVQRKLWIGMKETLDKPSPISDTSCFH